jgi:microcystin-dependent protein
MLDGRTIAKSVGGTARNNVDTQALYKFIYNSINNTFAPVLGGRDPSNNAQTDFDASKPITLPDLRGATVIAPDNLGGTLAGRITTAGSGVTGTNLGQRIGRNTVTLTAAQIPPHVHTYTLTAVSPDHSHTMLVGNDGDISASGAGPDSEGSYLPVVNVSEEIADVSTSDSLPAHAHVTVLQNNSGTGSAHNNMMVSMLVNWMIKL